MATTTTWDIEDLDRQTADGIVYNVHYSINANDGTYSAGSYGSIALDAPAEGDAVIPFADLTKEVVLGWTQSALGGADHVTAIENGLQKKITEQITPTKASGLPW